MRLGSTAAETRDRRLQRLDRAGQSLPALGLEIIVGLPRQHVAEAGAGQSRNDDQDRQRRDDRAEPPARPGRAAPGAPDAGPDQASNARSSRSLKAGTLSSPRATGVPGQNLNRSSAS